ncbi:MAG: hypothetical protein ACFFAO_11650, partial [Candidatus Hermodarchaeota archaeon]
MNKKGKFKLLSYIIEDSLIFYESLDTNRKFLAFSLVETEEIYPLFSLFKECLKKRILNYFSIQLNVNDFETKTFLLNFEDNDKERIVQLFNLIHEKIDPKNRQLKFLSKSVLEKKFLNLINKKMSSNLTVLKSNESVIIKNHSSKIALNFFTLNLLNQLN